MTKIMDDIYYLLVERVGRQYAKDTRTKILIRRKIALQDEIGFRIGEGWEELLDELTNLEADIETIYDKALFREALRLGTEIVRPSSGTSVERCIHSGAEPRAANGFNN